jgi:hypothetical protein
MENNECTYGFVDENNILIQVANFIENDFETIERVKNEYQAFAFYKMNLEKESPVLNIAYWNGTRFLLPSQFPSWVWNEELNSWVAPVPIPDDGKPYFWSEETLSWIEFNIAE